MATQYRRLNEIHFVDREEFLQMAPAIVQLEITRLSEMLAGLEPGSDVFTAVVATRYQLKEFLSELASERKKKHTFSTDRVSAAILCLGASENCTEQSVKNSLVYVADRLGYILAQMKRLR